ncbi:MAG: 50S ribosomal protein L3 [Myxococcales bacterium]|nr:50S ribosomal protein L3 [Myxococcales bacterium]
MQGVLGQKLGMTVVFREDRQIPVTAVKVDGNVVVGKRTEARDGYNALILGVGEQRVSRLSRPVVGQFRAAGLVDERDGQELVKRHVREFRVTAEQLEAYTVGQAVKITDLFKVGEKADVTSTSKGRGFSGVMKRHNFAGFKASHGVHEYFRHGGSIGSNTTPARVMKNKKMPGQHGNRRSTIQNVEIIEILADEGIVLLKGGVPGARGGLVQVRHAVKIRR